MKILFTICARAGSKGVQGKNIRDFCGYPILYHTLSAYELFLRKYGGNVEAALAVNTDSDMLTEQLKRIKLNSSVVARKPELAGDTVSKISVITDTLAEMERRTGVLFDLVVDMDLTSPLRTADDVKNVISAFFAVPGADAALSVTTPRRNPYFNQLVKGEGGFLQTAVQSDFVSRQQAPPVYDANASLYTYSSQYVRHNDGVLLHAKLVGSMMRDTAVLDIDKEDDFELLQVVAGYYYKTYAEYREVYENIKMIL